MSNKTISDTPMYTDIQGLARLNTEYKINPELAKTHVAEQFASLFMQMVMTSMRQANDVISSDLFSSNEMGLYQDLFDKQLSITMAGQSNGLVSLIKKNMEQHLPEAQKTTAMAEVDPTLIRPKKNELIQNHVTKTAVATKKSQPAAPPLTPEEFVRMLWPAAQTAAEALQINPEVLIAQAALETNWGKSVIPHPKSGTSHNVFNIKADTNWSHSVATATTLEEQDEVLVKQKANFKVYDSYMESFQDYVTLLKNNGRYSQALAQHDDPQSFIKGLQEAGFATDSHYAEKIWQICNSNVFKQIVKKVTI
jgi:peptidoglycan hydrolase FlgJ